MIEVLATGMLTTVQDHGRTGLRRLGVSPSGPSDRTSAQLANRLVGNLPGVALLEVTLGGLEIVAHRAVVCALAGAPCALLIDDQPVDGPRVELGAGQRLRLSAPTRGLRSYVACAGGVTVERTLGSMATDLLGGMGPAPIAVGDKLEVGGVMSALVPVPDAVPWLTDPQLAVEATAGPHLDWFGADALTQLTAAPWRVGVIDRVATRLNPGALGGRPDRELPSAGLVRGAVQVTGDGTLIVMGAEFPTTGGYPIVAVTTSLGADRIAQARPGGEITFTRAPERPTPAS